jgi:uncharacterized protein
VVRLLLERGADPSFVSRGGYTALMGACSGERLEVVRLLLGHASVKATINQRCDYSGGTALRVACIHGRGDIVRELLENGADPTIPDNKGRQDPYGHRQAAGRP